MVPTTGLSRLATWAQRLLALHAHQIRQGALTKPTPGVCSPGISRQGRSYPHHQGPGQPQWVGWRLPMSPTEKYSVTAYQQKGCAISAPPGPELPTFLQPHRKPQNCLREHLGKLLAGQRRVSLILPVTVSARSHCAGFHLLILILWNPFMGLFSLLIGKSVLSKPTWLSQDHIAGEEARPGLEAVSVVSPARAMHLHYYSVTQSCLFATPWTAAHQASLSFTISQSLLRLMVIESMMPSN